VGTTAASAAPDGARTVPPAERQPRDKSGPAVARVFHRLLALVSLCAWASLASQVHVLAGSRGLLPASELFARARAAGQGFWQEPSLLWLCHGDAALAFGAACGGLLAMLALLGIRARLCFALSAPLYLSFATVGDEFTAFQWDNMLVEATLLAAFLPADRPAPLAHFALRVLLFKLYFESGIAKWQSHLQDWHDGSAMSFYYETAPLPAALGWYMHQLPAWFHRLESWSALVLELAVPLLIWGPRRARLAAFAAFTGFQLINTATANYGFFTYLSLALHVFLLSDRDVASLDAAVRRLLPGRLGAARAIAHPAAPVTGLVRAAGAALLALWLTASAITGWLSLSRSSQPARSLVAVYRAVAPWRVANAYHLFGHITRARIEPQFEARVEGEWREYDLHYKPGAPERPPPYVAPHQPRVDFRLWFYGLAFQRGMPRYVHTLLERLCHEPEAVAALFATPLPQAPDAVRITFYRYRFTSFEQRARSGAFWRRDPIFTLPARRCR
jgi:lipase maturation factor 1